MTLVFIVLLASGSKYGNRGWFVLHVGPDGDTLDGLPCNAVQQTLQCVMITLQACKHFL